MIDTHCHLTWPDFDTDREAVIDRAFQVGVTQMITIGAGQGIAGNAVAVALAEQHAYIYAAIGLHPHDATLFTPALVEQLATLAAHPKIVAIGEIGLDYHHNVASHEAQYAAFRAQLELARRLDLPILVHQREAEDDLLAILDDVKGVLVPRPSPPKADGRPSFFGFRGILHCFGGSIRSRGQSPTLANVGGRTAPPDSPHLSSLLEFAQEMIGRGFLLGIGGIVTFKNAEPLRQVLKQLPIDRLVLETDAPYLAPVPYRGKRNEPAHIMRTAIALAETMGLSLPIVLQTTTTNSSQLFRLPPATR